MGTCINKAKTNPRYSKSHDEYVPQALNPISNEIPVSTQIQQTLSLPHGISIVWLDVQAAIKSKSSLSIKSMLEEIHSSVFFFDNVANCLNALSTVETKKTRVFLVVSGKYSTDVLPNLSKLSVIDSVFIFCFHPDRYEHLVTQYRPLIVGVFSDENILRSCLETELNQYNLRAPALNFFAQKQSATRDLTYDAASFLWFQLIQRVLMQTQCGAQDMKEMLNYCQEQYARNLQQQKYLSDIDEFARDYRPEKALNWYTRQSFIYKLVNSALRTEDIEALYIFRFFISDLCRQLAKESKKFYHRLIEGKKPPTLILYRGTRMTAEEVEKLQDTVGGMTSINGFVSTSLQRWVADQFLQHSSSGRKGVQKVLWIIRADILMTEIIVANVASFSEHPEEEEVLFNIGTAFCIDKVRLNEETNIWHVEASVTTAGAQAVAEYMKLIERELYESSVEVILGTLLMDMGKFVRAQFYFENLIRDTAQDKYSELAALHYNLGLTYSFQKDLDSAENNLLQAIEYQQMIPLKQRNTVRAYNALGSVYQVSGQLSEAMQFYLMAGAVCNKQFQSDDLSNAQTYTNMGQYYLVKQMYDEARDSYERAVKILKIYLPESHQRIGILYNEMGDVYRKQGETQKAMGFYEQADSILGNILPEHHPCRAYCWSSMGILFLQMNDLEEAQRYHKKALKTYKRVLPADHINISISEKNLKCQHFDYIIDKYIQVCSQV